MTTNKRRPSLWGALRPILVAGSLLACVSSCAEHDARDTVARANIVTMRGKPLTLVGTPVRVGDAAPDVRLVANDMSDKRLSDYRGKVVILSTVPSLDTSVCDKETRTFNEKAAELPGDVVVLTVSMDLPFAQRRWCGAAGIERVVTLSDFKYREAGDRLGLRIQENQLLTRAVMVIDQRGVIRFLEIVPDVSGEPDYDAVLNAAKALRD